MGGFWGSVHVRSHHHAKVIKAAAHVCAPSRRKCLVSPVIDGWIGIYPDGHGQDPAFGAEIAQRIGGDVLAVVVHDDSCSYYWLWRNRRLVDRYVSAPGALDIDHRDEEEPLCGSPEAWASLVGSEAIRELRDVFRRDDEKIVFEHERLLRLAELIGLPNPVCAYEYLQDGEIEDVIEWSSFVEVPKPRAARLRLVRMEPTGPEPVVVVQGRGNVFPAWTGFVRLTTPRLGSVQHLAPPDWEPVRVPLPFEDEPHTGSVEATGRIAAFSLPGRVAVVDLQRREVLAEVNVTQRVHALALARDGGRLAHVDEGDLVVTEIPSGRVLRRFPSTGDSLRWHPNGRWLATREHQISFVDVDDGTSHEMALATTRLDPRPSLLHMGAKVLSKVRSAAEREEVTANLRQMLDAFSSGPLAGGIPLDQVRSFDWSRDGSQWWLVTTTGILLFDWARLQIAVRAGMSKFPTPLWRISDDSGVIVADGIESGSLLLGTGNGRVQRMDRATGACVAAIDLEARMMSLPSVSLDGEWIAVSTSPLRGEHELRVWPATVLQQ